jgi:transposase
LTVTEDERVVLVRWSRRPKSPHSIAQRARIVVLAAAGMANVAVADTVGVNQATVVKWRKRFLTRRLDGLVDEPRPGAPRTISDDEVERVIVRTLEDTPTDATHWSTRDLAAKVGMSASSVGRIWQAFGLKPWLVDTFKLSEDPLFVEKVRDVVGLYMNPPDHAVVVCVDEKAGMQALDRTQPLPMRPGQIGRRTHDSVRHGVTDLFAALNLATGQVVHQTAPSIGRSSSVRFSTRSTTPCLAASTSMSCWATPQRTRPPRSSAGCSATLASRSTSRRRVRRG